MTDFIIYSLAIKNIQSEITKHLKYKKVIEKFPVQKTLQKLFESCVNTHIYVYNF